MKPGVTKSVIAGVDKQTSQCSTLRPFGFTRDPSATNQEVQCQKNTTEFLLGRSKIFLDILE